jgi:NADH:ubiquinone oxidoreductase subunit K
MEYFIYFINTEHTGWEFLLQALCALLSFKRDLVVLIMSLELLFLTLSLEFLDIAEKLDDINGQIFVLFILAISACESAVALAMFLSLYQRKGTEMQMHIKYIKG